MTPTKPFTWSYSGLTLFEQCPKQFWHLRIAKDVKDEPSPPQDWGKYVHTAFQNRIEHRTRLPPELERNEALLAQFDDRTQFKDVLCERKWALTRDYRPTGYFDSNVWGRCLADLIAVVPGPPKDYTTDTAVVLDWKTGRPNENTTQLKIIAAFALNYYPLVGTVKAAFVWLKDGTITRAEVKRGEQLQVWNEILPRVNALEQAVSAATMPAKPSHLCGWCAVKTCAHHP